MEVVEREKSTRSGSIVVVVVDENEAEARSRGGWLFDGWT